MSGSEVLNWIGWN